MSAAEDTIATHIGLFDTKETLNVTTAASNVTNTVDYSQYDAINDEYTNEKRKILMCVLFSALMVLYIGFCFYYQKIHKARRSVGDSLRGVATTGITDERRRHIRDANQAVLDESSDATTRARRDAEALVKLEARKKKIREALSSRLIVDDDEVEIGEERMEDGELGKKTMTSIQEEDKKMDTDDTTGGGESQNFDDSPGNTAADVTLSSSNETITAPATGGSAHRSSSSSCMEIKKYTDAIQASLSPSNCSSRGKNFAANCSNHSCITSSTNENSNGNATNASKKSLSNIIQIHGEECNICLCYFQVGDRAAWSSKRTSCRHAFHEECISRWLLVRDGCPICRRSYLEEEDDNGSDPSAVGGSAERVVDSHEIDLERGHGVSTSSSAATPNVVIAVEE